MAAIVKFAFGASLAALALSGAQAQDAANDPTRPPAHLLAPPAAAQSANAPDSASAPALELQAIMRSSDGSASATINGWVVRRGDSISGARVLEIGAQHALVQVGAERHRLTLTPGIRRISRTGSQPDPAAQAQITPRKHDAGEKK